MREYPSSLTKAEKYNWWFAFIILIVWTGVNATFLYTEGIVRDGEATKYISEAHWYLLHGRLSDGHYRMYSVQIGILVLCLYAKIGWGYAVAVQLLLNLVATYSLFRTLKFLFAPVTALVGTLVFLLNLPYQEFNVHLQTESIFFSITIILSSILLLKNNSTNRRITGIIALIIIACCTRPTGFLFVLPVALYLIFPYLKRKSLVSASLLALGSCVLFLFIIYIAMGTGNRWDFLLPFRLEEVICDVPQLNKPAWNDAGNHNVIQWLWQCSIHQPAQVLDLLYHRTLSFFGLYRSYYSPLHNGLLLSFYSILYILAVTGIIKWRRTSKSALLYCMALIGFTWLSVLITCDDWHNRFFLSISPYFIILALAAFSTDRPKQDFVTTLKGRPISS